MQKTKVRRIEFRIKKLELRNFFLNSQFSILNSPFLCLACCLLSFLTAAVQPCNGDQSLKDRRQNTEDRIQNSNSCLMSSVSFIRTKKDEEEQGRKNKLQQLITQIRSIRYEQGKKSPNGSRKTDSQPPTRLVSAERAVAGSGTIQPRRIKEVAINEPNEESLQLDEHRISNIEKQACSAQTLQMLDNLTQSASGFNQIQNPLQLAEILFFSGNLKQAAAVYQQALTYPEQSRRNRTEPRDGDSADPNQGGENIADLLADKAWILFQIGNCLRDDDPLTAKKMYRQLITEYPNCPWADLAKSRMSFIEWFLNEKPQKLITECKF